MIPQVARRTYIDDAVSPSAAMAATPTPGPCMLPYLEIVDGPMAATRPAPSSRWHEEASRGRVDKNTLWCVPLYAAPHGVAKHVPGGTIPAAKRAMF